MELILIRHVHSDNRRQILTELGHVQAKALAKRMRGCGLDSLYVSPLPRAQLTSRYIADTLNITPITLDWLGELDPSLFFKIEDYMNIYLSEVKNDAPSKWWNLFYALEERVQSHLSKVVNGFDGLIKDHGYTRAGNIYRIEQANEDVIGLISHGGTILTIIGHLLRLPLSFLFFQMEIHLASITRFIWKRVNDEYAIPKLVLLNDRYDLGNIV